VRSAVGRAAALTWLIHLFALAAAYYPAAIYDWVLPAQSMPLLVNLSLGAAGLHIAHGFMDVLRGRLLSRGGGAFHAALRDDIFAAIQLVPLRVEGIHDPLLPVRDLDQIRACLSGGGVAAILDLICGPAYLAAVYFLHPALGLFALGGALSVALLAFLADAMTTSAHIEAAKRSALRIGLCETVVRDAKAARATWAGPRLQGQWRELSSAHAAYHQIALDAAGAFAGAGKALRMIVQSGLLGLGVYFLMRDEISVGIMMAASILTSRALAPIEAVSLHSRSLTACRQSYRRLCALCEGLEAERARAPAERACWMLGSFRL
jgi:ATP-binding cassette subfamily C protein